MGGRFSRNQGNRLPGREGRPFSRIFPVGGFKETGGQYLLYIQNREAAPNPGSRIA